MNTYVDGFVFVVPNSKLEEYKKMAEMGRDSWMKGGALAYYECRGDEMAARDFGGGAMRAFPEMVGAGEDESVWFSFIIFSSKEHRDEVNAKVMVMMNEMAPDMKDFQMPFDMKKMAYGGFVAEVEGKK